MFQSDYLTDLYTGKSKNKFVKNCPQWGLKPGPPDLQSNALATELSQHSVASLLIIKSCSIDSRNDQSPTCEVVHETKLTSEISCPTDSCLAQLVRHWPEDSEDLVSIPNEGNFWLIFFGFSLCKDLSDNLTETPIVKYSNLFNILQYLPIYFCSMSKIGNSNSYEYSRIIHGCRW